MNKDLDRIQNIINDIKSADYYEGDLSDLGNSLGAIVGVYILDGMGGFSKDDFISGIEHGISLQDGTHI